MCAYNFKFIRDYHKKNTHKHTHITSMCEKELWIFIFILWFPEKQIGLS